MLWFQLELRDRLDRMRECLCLCKTLKVATLCAPIDGEQQIIGRRPIVMDAPRSKTGLFSTREAMSSRRTGTLSVVAIR
jgi:hypothetical protein